MKPKIGGLLGVVLGATFAGFMLTILLAVAIWPGEAKLTAPLLCPDDQPDAFVVADTYSPQPGETTTNFTLYCVGPRGDATDKGFAVPLLVLTAVHTGAMLLLFLFFAARTARRIARLHPGVSLEDAARQELNREMADQLAAQVARSGGAQGAVAPPPPVDDDGPPPPEPEGTIPSGPIIS